MPETEDIDAKERDRRIAAALAEAEALEVEPKEPFDTVHAPNEDDATTAPVETEKENA